MRLYHRFFLLSLIAALMLICFPLAFSFESPVYVRQVVLADLSGDGYPDAYVVVTRDGEPYGRLSSHVLVNDGAGDFTDSGQRLELGSSTTAAAGDLDSDGDIDLVANEYGLLMQYRNDGSGTMESLGGVSNAEVTVGSEYFALADLDGNGTLDVYAAGCCGGMTGDLTQPLYPYDTVWLNEGDELFRGNGQLLSKQGSNAVALGDLNGDGSPDAFLAVGSSIHANVEFTNDNPNQVWLNDGHGNFHDSGQRLGMQESLAVALGDLNGDGSLDAVVGNRGADNVWFNDGSGNFTAGSQSLGEGATQSIHLADLDSDGDLDVLTAGEASARLWFNDGAGHFRPEDQRIEYRSGGAVAVGDVDGDGTVDALVVGEGVYQLWRNDGHGRFTADARQIAFSVGTEEAP